MLVWHNVASSLRTRRRTRCKSRDGDLAGLRLAKLSCECCTPQLFMRQLLVFHLERKPQDLSSADDNCGLNSYTQFPNKNTVQCYMNVLDPAQETSPNDL